MNRVRADQVCRANENDEPASKKINGASYLERKREDASPIDAMRETADHLVRIATKAFMQMRNVDLETAQRWIAGAAIPEAKTKEPAPKSRKARS